MKKIKMTVLSFLAIGTLSVFNAKGQTYGSGALTNTCTPTAGTTGTNGTFIGCGAGNLNGSSAVNNTAVGYDAGYNHKILSDNTAVGYNALYTNGFNVSGTAYSTYNVAVGGNALYTNNPTSTSNGYRNTAIGYNAGKSNTTGSINTFAGFDAGMKQTTASYNSIFGYQAGYNVTTGGNNTVGGYQSGVNITSGTDNTCWGYNSGYTIGTNTATAIGAYNTCIGSGADVSVGSYTNAGAFGYNAVASNNDYIKMGNSSITTAWVQVDWTIGSDGRFKNNITENVKGLAFINKLRPITYNMDTKKFDNYIIQNMSDTIKAAHNAMDFTASTAKVHSGFIAQEVEQAAQQVGFTSSIVHHPENSTDPYGIAYSEMVVPVVKAIQEISHKDDSRDSIIAAMQKHDNAKDSIIAALLKHNHLVDSLLGIAGANNRTMQNSNGGTNPAIGATSIGTISTVNTIDLASGGALIYQNAPNPFGDGTMIKYYVPDGTTNAQVIFYDEFGNQLKTFAVTETGAGQLNITSANLAPGTYSYSLMINGKVIDTKKMVKTN